MDNVESTFHCEICYDELNSQNIQIKKDGKFNIAYVVCKTCEHEHTIMIDNKETERIKDKLAIVKQIDLYLKAQLFIEQESAVNDYYEYLYNSLSYEEQKAIGEFVPTLTQEQKKEFMQEFKQKEYGFKEIMKLWKL